MDTEQNSRIAAFRPSFLRRRVHHIDNKQEALRYLKIAYDRHLDGLAESESDHAFDKLSHEPVFGKMLTDVDLPPLQ